MIDRAFVSSIVLLALGGPAAAGPDVYINTFPVSLTQGECLSETKKILLRAGFSNRSITQATYKAQNGEDIQDGWNATHADVSMTAAIECNAPNGVGAFAISGLNSSLVYGKYKEVFRLFFE